MPDADKRPFIPRDKPKSWTIFVVAVLTGLLVGGPITLIGIFLDYSLLSAVGRIVFFGSWIIGFSMWVVYVVGNIQGKYRDIKELPWSEQVW